MELITCSAVGCGDVVAPVDSTWESECACHRFESQCCQLGDYVTSLGKM